MIRQRFGDAIRQEASKLAMDDARQKAQKLADLAGVKLGKVVAVLRSV